MRVDYQPALLTPLWCTASTKMFPSLEGRGTASVSCHSLKLMLLFSGTIKVGPIYQVPWRGLAGLLEMELLLKLAGFKDLHKN